MKKVLKVVFGLFLGKLAYLAAWIKAGKVDNINHFMFYITAGFIGLLQGVANISGQLGISLALMVALILAAAVGLFNKE